MNAEAIPETHNSKSTATISLFSGVAREMVFEIPSAIVSIRPMYCSPPIIIKRPAKKIIVVHSTASSCSSTW